MKGRPNDHEITKGPISSVCVSRAPSVSFEEENEATLPKFAARGVLEVVLSEDLEFEVFSFFFPGKTRGG